MAKSKEQKRREAYDRLVKQAQGLYSWYMENKDIPDNVRGGLFSTNQQRLNLCKELANKVWEFHRKFGYPLPETNTFYNH